MVDVVSVHRGEGSGWQEQALNARTAVCVQVNFFDDHTKVIVSAEAQDYLVTYIDSKRHSVSYQLLQLRHFGCSVHVVDRLKYARHVLQTVINIAGEPV